VLVEQREETHLVREPLDVDGVAEEVVEGEHVGEGRASAIVVLGNGLERRTSGLVAALAVAFIAAAQRGKITEAGHRSRDVEVFVSDCVYL
jgi:hypothetical protein